MITDGRTLVVVADGARARLFEEARRGGPLTEHEAWAAGLAPGRPPRAPVGSVHDRMGHALHGLSDPRAADHAARDYLRRLAQRLDEVARREAFDGLVLFAPPRALGLLREALSPALRARLQADAPADRLADDAEALRGHVQALRLKGA